MIRDQFMTVSEMKDIITMCEVLDVVHNTSQELMSAYIPLLETEDGGSKVFPVRDGNGDILGHIGYAEGGFALYLDDGVEDDNV